MNAARFKLKLYVQSGNSGQALSQLYKALEYHSYSDYELAIIDVNEQPTQALEDGITKTPTLVSEAEGGGWLISDDFRDIDKLRATFGFRMNRRQ